MSKKIILSVGVPYSGKSTYFKKLISENPKTHALISRDKVRETLFGFNESEHQQHYEKADVYKREKLVTEHINEFIHYNLSQDKTVIIDATHLSLKHITPYEFFNVPIELIFFEVTKEEISERIPLRHRGIGWEIINTMINQYKSLKNELEKNPYNFEPRVIVQNEMSEEKKVILVDIDGTVANMKGVRTAFEWKKVHLDAPIRHVIDVVKALDKTFKIIFVSGRDACCYNETSEWIKKHIGVNHQLYMRAEKDMRADWMVKEEIWDEIMKDHEIVMMIDDRSQVVKRARYLGFNVLQVDWGNF